MNWIFLVVLCVAKHFLFLLFLLERPSEDGIRWRGAFGECAYRCSANLTMTAPCGNHKVLTWYARLVLMLHAVCANLFVSMVVTIGFDIDESDGPQQRRVNAFMQRNKYYIALATGAFMFAYMYIVKWLLMLNITLNKNRKASFWKTCCSFFERIAHIPIMIMYVMLQSASA